MSVAETRLVHRALLHDGPEDLARRAAPELQAALGRGEPVHVSLTHDEWAVLSSHLGPLASTAVFLPAEDRYVNPGRAMAALHTFVHESTTRGAEAVWSIGSVRIDGDHERDARWARYETAVDHVLREVPLHGICAYDRTRSSAEVIEAVRRCHTLVDDPTRGIHPCTDHDPYDHASATHAHRATTPDLELWDPEPAKVRSALTDLCHGVLDQERLADLHLVATELVTNGMRHGDRPIGLQTWLHGGGVVVEAWDHGPGLSDPYADMRPHRGGGHGGHGMWLIGQLSDQVSIGREGGRTVVVAGLQPTR